MKVVDACAIVELLLRTEQGLRVDKALGDSPLAAPELLDVEVASALVRLIRSGRLDSADADIGRQFLSTMPISRISHGPLTDQAWELRDRVQIADAFYVACAEHLACELVTTDGRLARAPLPGIAVTYVQ